MDSRTMGEERSFAPPADISTFRDLLIFEERVKQNSARLHARRRNYECMLRLTRFPIRAMRFYRVHVLLCYD